jgi:hypothetical protein
VSADTFGVGVKKVKSKAGKLTRVARKAASKIPGLRRFGGKRVIREELTAIESVVNVACFGESETELAAVEARLDRVSQWMSEVDYATDQGEENIRLLELRATLSQSAKELLHERTSKEFAVDESVAVPIPELAATSSDLSDETVQRTVKNFTIDGGVAVPTSELPATSSTSSNIIVNQAGADFAIDAGIVPATPTTKELTADASIILPATRPDLVESIESIEELYNIALASVSQLALAEEPRKEFTRATRTNSVDSIEKLYQMRAAPISQTSFAEPPCESSAPTPPPRPTSIASIEELYHAVATSVGPSPIAEDLRRRESAQAIAIAAAKSGAEETRVPLRDLRVPGIEDPPTPVEVKKRKWDRLRVRGLLRSER